MLSQFRGRFRFVRKGGGKGAKAGYIKLKEYGISMPQAEVDLPSQEVYISNLICYMHRGPPPSPALEARHLFENRLCMAPWHLVWDSHSNNIKGYYVHRRDKRKYHPYTLPGLPAPP